MKLQYYSVTGLRESRTSPTSTRSKPHINFILRATSNITTNITGFSTPINTPLFLIPQKSGIDLNSKCLELIRSTTTESKDEFLHSPTSEHRRTYPERIGKLGRRKVVVRSSGRPELASSVQTSSEIASSKIASPELVSPELVVIGSSLVASLGWANVQRCGGGFRSVGVAVGVVVVRRIRAEVEGEMSKV
ncbi:hypothetical protein Droror1_Dr00021207 [Drosera rotundifolia]